MRPGRKQRSPTELALDKLVAMHHGDLLAALTEALEVQASPQAQRVFARHLYDPEELERALTALYEQVVDAHIGKKQREAGRLSPGRRGKAKVAAVVLRGAVLALHTRSPRLTFNDVCDQVGRRCGYKSGWSAKQAALDIKWPDPRSKQK